MVLQSHSFEVAGLVKCWPIRAFPDSLRRRLGLESAYARLDEAVRTYMRTPMSKDPKP